MLIRQSEIKKSCSLYVHIIIFYVVVSKEFFFAQGPTNTNNFSTDQFDP